MPFANVYDMDGKIVREEELDPYVFGAPVNVGLLHQVVTSQLVNRRQGTASTKTRGEVSGGAAPVRLWARSSFCVRSGCSAATIQVSARSSAPICSVSASE